MGEDRYKKLISLYEKYDIPVLPNGIPIGSSQIDPQLLTLEEQFFIIEIFENYNKFFKQFMSERVMKIEDSFLETEKQIDNLDIPEKEKSQHIQEIFQYKEVMIKGIVNTVSKPLVTEEQIIESKKKLELEAELRGISLESIEMSDESTYTFEPEPSESGGGCLIATAAYGSEMATEVQQLRELRDNQLLQTESGVAFMGTFNDIYYSFSPIIADYERENPYFKEAVKIAITPMISSLSLMENANSESEVLSIGISVIALNIGMYLGIPVIAIVGLRRII